MKRNLVLIHGWGVNSRVWDSILRPLEETFSVTPIDLPGSGALAKERTGTDLEQLAQNVLLRSPKSAVWCGWSLGGMVAMAAALQQPERIEKLSLVCTTPRFMEDVGWDYGSNESSMTKLASQFKSDYAKALTRFFLLQLGSIDGARNRSRELAANVMEEAEPSWNSLEDGLNLLRTVDLRDELSKIDVATQVIAGANDQVIPCDAGRYLANKLPDATLVEAHGGHVPFITSSEWFVDQLKQFAGADR